MTPLQTIALVFMYGVAICGLYTAAAYFRLEWTVGTLLKTHSYPCVAPVANMSSTFYASLDLRQNLTSYFVSKIGNCSIVEIGKPLAQ
jgi:hypothetical protein